MLLDEQGILGSLLYDVHQVLLEIIVLNHVIDLLEVLVVLAAAFAKPEVRIFLDFLMAGAVLELEGLLTVIVFLAKLLAHVFEVVEI
jgi:hypothetical protein